jgi:hypothetical protein
MQAQGGDLALKRAQVVAAGGETAGQIFDAGVRAFNEDFYEKFKKPRLLEDGTLGYPMRVPRTDDCFAAAIATTLQVPIEEVPDPRIDERLAAGEAPEEIDRRVWANLTSWLASRDLRIIPHRKVPAARRRWIGVVPISGNFRSHCLVMSHERLLFDPANNPSYIPRPDGRKVRTYQPDQITFGLSFRSLHKT